MESERQRFDTLVIHTPHGDRPLRAALDLLDLRLPRALRAALARLRRRRFETAKVNGRARAAERRRRDRGRDRPRRRSPRRWSSTRSAGAGCSPPATATSRPTRRSRAGSRSTPAGSGEDLEIWIDRRYVPAGYGWSFPAGDELRIGVGSFDPRFHVKETTELLAEDLGKRAESATRATGSPTSCAARPRAASSSPATRPATACR